MSDFNSSLPIRTETNGDVVAKLVDFTTNTQGLKIDAAGLISSKLFDAAGTGITSQLNGSQQALDVGIDVGGVQIDPRQIRALTSSDVVTANQGTPNTNANAWWVHITDGTNNANVTAGGQLTVQDSNFPTTVDTGFGSVGASTIRTASQIGNATGAADFNAGATGAQTLRVAANLYDNTGTPFSATNPLPVTIDTAPGTSINDFKDAAAIAANATDNHDYTVTAGKTLYLSQVESSASGMAKMQLAIETGVATGVFTTKFVQFNSTATGDMSLHLTAPIPVAAGVRVRVTMTNRDKAAQDLYSTISGTEK